MIETLLDLDSYLFVDSGDVLCGHVFEVRHGALYIIRTWSVPCGGQGMHSILDLVGMVVENRHVWGATCQLKKCLALWGNRDILAWTHCSTSTSARVARHS